jgi:signal transduction histidine kinase
VPEDCLIIDDKVRERSKKVINKLYTVGNVGRRNENSRMGLGLNIAQVIIQAHGGEIWAESEINQRSTLCFTFPAHDLIYFKYLLNKSTGHFMYLR